MELIVRKYFARMYRNGKGASCATCSRMNFSSKEGKADWKVPIPELSPFCPMCRLFDWLLGIYTDAERQSGGFLRCSTSALTSAHPLEQHFTSRVRKQRTPLAFILVFLEAELEGTPVNTDITRYCVVSDFGHWVYPCSERRNKSGKICWGDLHPDSSDFLVYPNHINYKNVRSLITSCIREHECCRPRLAKALTKTLQHFRLIHCESRRVILIQEPRDYVALSYVWGNDPYLPDNPGAEPIYPATIQDAIQVTMQLGFEYLWVDRYCIDQTSTHKTTQVQQMGQIYYQASLTIFATAGTDPSYGLPGVSRARSLPDTAVGGKYVLTPIPDKPRRYIQQSLWATRGWTYQEAYLSRRRLFFTDAQLYFECATAPRDESVFYKGLHIAPSDDCLFPRPDFNLPDDKILFNCVVDYSHREFGFMSDRLRGFLGILAAFATRSRYRTYHIWGIPVKLISYGAYKPLLGLFGSTPSDRSPGFPSWSWVGWSGQALNMDFQSEDYQSLVYSVELEKGDRTEALTSTLLQRYYSFGTPPEAVPAVLRLSGMSFPIYAAKDYSPSPGCRLALTDKRSYCAFPTDQKDLKELVKDSDWVCWQDPDGVWIYANYHLIDTHFLDGQEGNLIELLGVPLVMESRLGKRLVAILRAVEGGYETVGYLPILSARFKTKFFHVGEDTSWEGNLIEAQEAYYLGWMKSATIRWL